MRRFEAALLVGGDARQLAPASNGEFFNQSVRRELGLRTREDGERELRRDLELLLATVPRVTVTWQAMQDGEANLLAPELANGITRVKGVASKGVRLGNWLSVRQAQTLLNAPDVTAEPQGSVSGTPNVPPALAETKPVTTIIQ